MDDILNNIFGTGRDLSTLQIAARSFAMFFIAIMLIRIAGMRSFGSKSVFDNIVVIMLGAILSRGVMGVSPFMAAVSAALVLCITHRVIAMLAARFHFFSVLVKGDNKVLYKDGVLNKENLLKCDLSSGDLEEGIRLAANISELDDASEVRMERSGQISVVTLQSKNNLAAAGNPE